MKTDALLQAAVLWGTDAFTLTLHLDWGVGRRTLTLGITKMTFHDDGLLKSPSLSAWVQHPIYR